MTKVNSERALIRAKSKVDKCNYSQHTKIH